MSKCIFIAPAFFGYEKKINDQLNQKFDEVIFFDERIGNSTYKKVLSRLALSFKSTPLIGNLLNRLKGYYTDKQYREYKAMINNVDFLLCIVPETIPEWFLLEIKNRNPKLKTVLYMWDSFKIRPYTLKITHHFDRIFTFDGEDADTYGYELLPLFYSEEYNKHESLVGNMNYEFCFIGTAHSDRYQIATLLKQRLRNNSFVFLYLQSKLQFYFLKLSNRSFQKAKVHDIHFSPMKSEVIADVISSSKAILDIQHPNQNGLTMRTIEVALGMRKKLITTNSNIKKYDFFNENNILVVDRKKIEDVDVSFFDRDYIPLNEEIYQRYSLQNWVNTLIN